MLSTLLGWNPEIGIGRGEPSVGECRVVLEGASPERVIFFDFMHACWHVRAVVYCERSLIGKRFDAVHYMPKIAK